VRRTEADHPKRVVADPWRLAAALERAQAELLELLDEQVAPAPSGRS